MTDGLNGRSNAPDPPKNMKRRPARHTIRSVVEDGIAQFESRYGSKPRVLVLHPDDAQTLFRTTVGGAAMFDGLSVLFSPLAVVPLLSGDDDAREGLVALDQLATAKP